MPMDNSVLGLFQPNFPRTRPPLDFDVLSTICAYLTEYPDLLSLSLTSSVFRPLAVRTMLRARPVVLKEIASILKFHDFVFSDPDARMPHVIALVIDVSDIDSDYDQEDSKRAIEALLAILKCTLCLVSLELRFSPDERPPRHLNDPRLSAAVCELVSLRELMICGRTEVTDFISTLRSPLTKLSLGFLNPVGGLEEWTPNSPLMAALSHFAPSLVTLSVKDSHVLLPSGPLFSLPASIQLRAVRSLTLNSLVIAPHVTTLFDLFPNLDGIVHLTTHIQPSFHFASLSECYEFFRRAREENGVAQERRRWKRLERLVCDVETLFTLNLRCPIGLTVVHGVLANATWVKQRCLVESLRDHPPTQLNLQVTGWCGTDNPAFGGLIPPEAAATLTHLTLCATYLHYSSPDPPPPHYLAVRWDDLWRDGLLPVVTPLHALTHFRLVLHLDAVEAAVPMCPITQDPLIEDLRPMSRARGRFNFAAVASKLADTLPSLRYCFLTNSTWVTAAKDVHSWPTVVVEQWRESRAWRVAHGLDVGHTTAETSAAAAVETRGTGRELVELHDDVAETIIQAEALVLSTEERQGVRWV